MEIILIIKVVYGRLLITIRFIILGIDDLQICRALLESKDWDLEATAREQFDPPDSRETIQQQRIEPHDEAPEAANYQNNLQSPRIIPERNVDDGFFQGSQEEIILPPQGSHPQSYTGHVNASRSTLNNRSNFPVRSGVQWGAFGILRWGFYLITLPITWPVRIAYNTATNIFGFLSNLLGFGHLFGNLAPASHQRGRRFLPRPPVTDARGII